MRIAQLVTSHCIMTVIFSFFRVYPACAPRTTVEHQSARDNPGKNAHMWMCRVAKVGWLLKPYWHLYIPYNRLQHKRTKVLSISPIAEQAFCCSLKSPDFSDNSTNDSRFFTADSMSICLKKWKVLNLKFLWNFALKMHSIQTSLLDF